jgi:hypothetical protein
MMNVQIQERLKFLAFIMTGIQAVSVLLLNSSTRTICMWSPEAKVNQHPPVDHPLDPSYDSVMDNPELELISGFTMVTHYGTSRS